MTSEHTIRPRASLRGFAACAIGALLAVGMLGCAPEPGSEAGAIDKAEQVTSPETHWAEADEEAEQRSTVLPESFPSEEFALPAGATIYDAGERGVGTWFLVLESATAADADSLWSEVVSLNGFEVSDEEQTVEGGVSAELQGLTLTVTALTLPRDDGSVLVSYDITQWV